MLTLEERYALARELQPGKREAKLLHGPVRPWWSADSRHFTYATRTADGMRYFLVDVAARTKASLLDEKAVAAGLAEKTSKEVKDEALGLTSVGYDAAADAATFNAHGAHWRWHRQTATLERVRDDFGPHEVRSPDGQYAISLDGPNLKLRVWGEAEGRPLTTDGIPEFGYGDYLAGFMQITARFAGLPVKPSVAWSPDSSKIAVVRADQRNVPLTHLLQSVPATGVRPVLHSFRYPMPADPDGMRLELWFIGRHGERVKAQLPTLETRGPDPLAFGDARWSAEGRYFDLILRDRYVRSFSFWRIDTHTGQAERLLEDSGPAPYLPAPSIGYPLMHRVLADGRVLAWSQRDGWGHLYLYSEAAGWQPITQGAWQVRSVLKVDEEAGYILFTAGGREAGRNPYFDHLYRVGLAGGEPTLLTPEAAHHEIWPAIESVVMPRDGMFSVAPDGRSFVDVWSTVTEPARSALRDTTTGAILLALETADPADGWPASMPSREPFTVEALDAANLPGCGELYGLIVKPADFDPAQKYPVVEMIYGGPQTAVTPISWSGAGNLDEQLAALGFVVVTIDGPGTPFRSHAFQCRARGNLQGCGNLPDHVAAIKKLAETRPWMDVERVGITGASGGGFATVRAMAEHPEFYKVGVSLCGDHDNTAYTAGWGDTYQGPFDNDVYLAQSNPAIAHNIVGNLFLIHGEMDDNVHPGHTLMVVDALIKADRNFDLLIVPNASHGGLAQPYVYRRSYDFFVTHLAGLEPPVPAPTPAPEAAKTA